MHIAGELSTMFSHEEAVKHQLILLLLGLDAYVHPVADLGWTVWLEGAGLQMFCANDVKGYLMLRWAQEQREGEMPNG